MTNLSKDEEQLLAAFAMLTNEQREIVLEAIQFYARNDHGHRCSASEQQQ